MKRNYGKKILLVLILLLVLSSCQKKTDKIDLDENKDEKKEEVKITVEEKIEKSLLDMTLEEKIGQLLIVGFEDDRPSSRLEETIENIRPAGLVFFGRNIRDKKQVLALNEYILQVNKKANPIPLFLAIDEEGGSVTRLSKIYGELPSASALGKTKDKDLAFVYGQVLGLRLKSLGFNLNLAPVLDINSNPSNPVIGNRALANKPEDVVTMSLGLIDGMNSKDILASGKHFPGHGDTDVDSHLDLPRLDRSLEEIDERELVPFKYAIKNKIDMVMVGHLLYSQLDPNQMATFSPIIKEELLRSHLGHEGIIVSDDLTMGAVLKNRSLEEATFDFLKTGGDLALVCHGEDQLEDVVSYIRLKLDQGEISEYEINVKLRRILRAKYSYNLGDDIKLDSRDEDLLRKSQADLLNKINNN